MIVNYPKPNFPKAYELCRKDCPGVNKCEKNGLMFYRDYFYKCPLYETNRKVRKIQKQLAQSVPAQLKDATVENYKPSNKSQHQLIEIVQRYLLKEVWREGKGIIICGPNGVGKTHIAVAIYRKVIEKNITAAFARPRMDGTFQEIAQFYKTLSSPKVLIYDDFGPELDREFMLNHLFNLFDKRINNNKGLIATTNLAAVELKLKFGTRIFSRLSKDNFITQLEGEDYRMKKRNLF